MSEIEPSAPSGASGDVRVFAQYDRDIDEQVDVVVVGSGPAGAVVSKAADTRVGTTVRGGW